MSKDKNRTSSSKHGHPATENTLRDTKRKFSDMLDETKDVIVEEKANSSQSIKESLHDLEQRLGEQQAEEKSIRKKFAKMEKLEKLCVALLSTAEGCKLPSEGSVCDALLKRRHEIEREVAVAFDLPLKNK